MTSPTPPPTGTIDITDLVSSLKDSFVSWAVAYIYGLIIAVPALSWLAIPGFSGVFKFMLKFVFNLLANSVVMEAFFLNTAIRKASQAQDYVAAIAAKDGLPPTASQKEYQDAEAKQMAAFRNFVMLSN